MMRFAELFSMTSEAARPVIGRSFPGSRRTVGIVTCRTAERVTRSSLARAFRKRFELTDRPRIAFAVAGQHEIVHVFAEIFTRLEVVKMLAVLFDRGVAFEMALHADCVALCRRKRG